MSNSDIFSKLKDIGLSDTEIRLYLYILESGTSSPPQIAKGISMARPNCYDVLRKLEDRNLIEHHSKGKRKVYIARDPLALVQLEEMRLQNIQSLVPELRNRYEAKKNKPCIEFLDGFEQVKKIWTMSVASDHIRGITSTKVLYANSPKFFDDYHKQLMKKGVLLQDIITTDSVGPATEWTKKEMGPMYETRVLPEKYLTLPTDILIWDDKVALIHITHPITATVITEQHMADTFRILFDLSWERLSD